MQTWRPGYRQGPWAKPISPTRAAAAQTVSSTPSLEHCSPSPTGAASKYGRRGVKSCRSQRCSGASCPCGVESLPSCTLQWTSLRRGQGLRPSATQQQARSPLPHPSFQEGAILPSCSHLRCVPPRLLQPPGLALRERPFTAIYHLIDLHPKPQSQFLLPLPVAARLSMRVGTRGDLLLPADCLHHHAAGPAPAISAEISTNALLTPPSQLPQLNPLPKY